jgi:hypothetical protein
MSLSGIRIFQKNGRSNSLDSGLKHAEMTDKGRISKKFRLISKRVGDERRLQGVKGSREMLRNYKELKVWENPINSVWRFIGLPRDFPR